MSFAEKIAKAKYMAARTGREFIVRNRSDSSDVPDEFLVSPRYLTGYEGLLMDDSEPIPRKVWPEVYE